jgi:hypothetical protein
VIPDYLKSAVLAGTLDFVLLGYQTRRKVLLYLMQFPSTVQHSFLPKFVKVVVQSWKIDI